MGTEALKPSATLLVKLGSIAVHAEEHLENFRTRPDAALFDEQALKDLLADSEVVAWREAMDAMAFLPVKRR